jgi:hypothetical protein
MVLSREGTTAAARGPPARLAFPPLPCRSHQQDRPREAKEIVEHAIHFPREAQQREERKEEQPSYRVSERRYGSFERSFRLPEGIDEGKIDAKFVKGLLTIRLPKSEEALQKERVSRSGQLGP